MIKPLSAGTRKTAVEHAENIFRGNRDKGVIAYIREKNEEFKKSNEEFKKAANVFSEGSDIKIFLKQLKHTHQMFFYSRTTCDINQYRANLETAAFAVAGQKFDLGDIDQCKELYEKLRDELEYLFYLIFLHHHFATFVYRSLVRKICEEADAALNEKVDAA
jgi:hypothetical protein